MLPRSRLVALLLDNRRLAKLRWRLSFSMLVWADRLVGIWLNELYDSLDDPRRAAAIFEDLTLQIEDAESHPFLIRFRDALTSALEVEVGLSKTPDEVCIEEEVPYGT